MKKNKAVIPVILVLAVILVVHLVFSSPMPLEVYPLAIFYVTPIMVFSITVLLLALLLVLFGLWDFLSNAWKILRNGEYWNIQRAKNYAIDEGYKYIEPIDIWPLSLVVSKNANEWYILHPKYNAEKDGITYTIDDVVYSGSFFDVVMKIKKIKTKM